MRRLRDFEAHAHHLLSQRRRRRRSSVSANIKRLFGRLGVALSGHGRDALRDRRGLRRDDLRGHRPLHQTTRQGFGGDQQEERQEGGGSGGPPKDADSAGPSSRLDGVAVRPKDPGFCRPGQRLQSSALWQKNPDSGSDRKKNADTKDWSNG